MPANFKIKRKFGRLPSFKTDPRILVRTLLGLLLVANIVAALFLLKPWASSAAEMEQQLSQLRQQVKQKKATIERLQVLTKKTAQARQEGAQFVGEYFLERRTAYSTIIEELKKSAEASGIEQKEHTYSTEPIEGSDNLSMMSINGNYEGAYENLVKFISLMDRSPRFLILSSLQAQPQRTEGKLNVIFRMNAFVIEQRPGEPAQAAGVAPDSGRAGT